jgi:hypothetical protein
MDRRRQLAPKVVGKDRLSRKEESGWKRPDLLWESSLTSSSTETQPFLSGMWTLGNKSSRIFVVCLTKLFSSIFDFLPLRSTWVCYLCVQGSLSCLWSSTKATHQVSFMLEVKRSLKLFLQVLCATLAWPVQGNGLSSALPRAELGPVWLVSLTGLTDGAWQFKFSRKKSLIWSSRIFTPPLGGIKVLSTMRGNQTPR